MLVIIGLLMGAVLKGKQLQDSARVRKLADATNGVRAAYLAFQDRFRRVPGDWGAAGASAGIGEPITGGGNDNGRLDNPPGANVYDEVNALWEQLSKAGIIKGRYLGTPGTEPTTNNQLAPLNVFNMVMVVGRSSDYAGLNLTSLHVVIGRGVPAAILRELDVKLDDGSPETGRLRATLDDSSLTVFTGSNFWGGQDVGCVAAAPPPPPPPDDDSLLDDEFRRSDPDAPMVAMVEIRERSATAPGSPRDAPVNVIVDGVGWLL